MHLSSASAPEELRRQTSSSPAHSFWTVSQAGELFVHLASTFLTSAEDNLYVVDTGNSRIKVLSRTLDFRNHIFNENLEGRSVTGVCLGSSGDTLVTVNWRTKTITEMNLDGRTIGGKRQPFVTFYYIPF